MSGAPRMVILDEVDLVWSTVTWRSCSSLLDFGCTASIFRVLLHFIALSALYWRCLLLWMSVIYYVEDFLHLIVRHIGLGAALEVLFVDCVCEISVCLSVCCRFGVWKIAGT